MNYSKCATKQTVMTFNWSLILNLFIAYKSMLSYTEVLYTALQITWHMFTNTTGTIPFYTGKHNTDKCTGKNHVEIYLYPVNGHGVDSIVRPRMCQVICNDLQHGETRLCRQLTLNNIQSHPIYFYSPNFPFVLTKPGLTDTLYYPNKLQFARVIKVRIYY